MKFGHRSPLLDMHEMILVYEKTPFVPEPEIKAENQWDCRGKK